MLDIVDKKTMYALLGAGKLGNALPQWVGIGGLEAWTLSGYPVATHWGVRSTAVANHPKTRLYTPRDEVVAYCYVNFPAGDFQLSPMIDQHAVFRGELSRGDDEPFGWYLRGGGGEMPGGSWRRFMAEAARDYSGSAVPAVLRHVLWPGDYDDLMTTLDNYPRHVVEFSACDRAVGVVPNRNTVIWEVRRY